ncbi:hypothetical protein J437_LFUL014854 [Ladona fulva]|uniref:G/T mismatch-specific thymine DNA glycosylase n=1 Tax=Ladona fulva TaxID=123851 RepID=A0A8K0KJT9_LADFU|nr:hypothetical protein J437_LFUL014854 [Ladona fulva]
MQVATLFRETATLLGATMEAQDAPGPEAQGLKFFVDDDPTPPPQPRGPAAVLQPVPKKRGRKKKIKPEEAGLENSENLLNGDPNKKKKQRDEKIPPTLKERKKHDRFNGMPEEEVSKRTLPDHLAQNLDIVIIGINPGLFAAYKGHHYAGPGNHFWKCLYLSGLTPEPMSADDDYKLLQYGVGFTNMVARATKGSADLTRKEIKEGSQILLDKLQKFKPKIAVFNGKLIYEVFSGKKDFTFGRQPDFVDGTNTMWVMPSSSARCAQLPRAADKVPFYAALKKFRDYLNGMIADLDETEVVFNDANLKNYTEPEIKDEPKEDHSFYGYGRLPSNGELTDLSNAIVKKEDQPPPKKKRGRPKKIKSENGEDKKEVCQETTPKAHKQGDAPKKKRGRPKKVKTEENSGMVNGLPEHTNSSMTLSNCFSPPIQSPTNFCQQNFSPAYTSQSQSYGSQNPSQSPSSGHNYHQSPVQRYSQSPQPPSQPFTHSDLSSEISAAISSEHNLGSPPPTSPSLGPPDFEPPTSMPEDTSDGAQNSSGMVKEENSGDNVRGQNECRFSSPTPPDENSGMNYQSYGTFSTESETNSLGYPSGSTSDYNPKRNMNQDVSSKSLSGLESLVDQIPSIADGETPPHSATVSGGSVESYDHSHAPGTQYNDESSYMGGYPSAPHYSGSGGSNTGSYSPHYTSASANYSVSTSNSYSLHHSSAGMNFSVTSLTNSSSSVSHDVAHQVPSSFSVTSLTSNYNSINSPMNSYSNLMGSPHPMGSHMMGGASGVGGGMFGGGSPMGSSLVGGGGMGGAMVDRSCGGMGSVAAGGVGLPGSMGSVPGSSALPYPYGQYSPGAPPSYAGAPGGGFPYAPPTHSLHVPSPNYPYPSPYSNGPPYPQPGYLQNHVLDRIKQDRMDIGFGGF